MTDDAGSLWLGLLCLLAAPAALLALRLIYLYVKRRHQARRVLRGRWPVERMEE